MSIAVEAISAPVSAEARPAPRFAWLRNNKWALLDQVLISGANFLTGVLTARALTQSEFGAFSIVFGVLLFANILQSTLITQAHNVLGATRVGREYQRYTGSTAFGQILMVAIEALLIVPVMLFAYYKGWAGAGMLVALIPAIVFWQLMEFCRRVLYTEGRYGAAFANDMISYGGQTALLIALYALFRMGRIEFTGALALYVLAGTAAIAAAVGFWQIRRSIVFAANRKDFAENWHFGKWLAGGELMGWCSSVHMQVWWAACLIGTVASADLRAAQILFGPARVITFFVFAALLPTVGIYCLLLAVFPQLLLRLVYGANYASAEGAQVLTLFAVCAFLSYLQMVIVAALTAGKQTRAIFVGSVWGCVVALAASPACILLWGSRGAIISMIVTLGVVTALYLRTYLRNYRNSQLEPASAQEP
jgi:O-antigen/teichoic acid export membrane protein